MVVYEEKLAKWEESHEMILAIIRLACEVGPRVHLTNVTNGQTALEILRKLYEGTDLSTIDISYREISRSNLENFSSIEAYSEHLKSHREKIIQAGETISEWQMSSAFRMGLPTRLNPYVFQLVHSAKTSGKELTIDEMVAALIAEEKRTDYDENEDAKARAVKNQKGGKTPSNKPSNEKKKKSGPCSYCKGLAHIEKQCYYLHPELRKEDWKPHETKLQLTKQWDKEKGFVASKPKKKEKGGKVKKVRSIASGSDESDSSSNPLRSARITKQCSIEGSARRLANRSTDPNFWLDSAADRHLCYDKALMHDIRPLTTPRLAEVADGRLMTVEDIGSITFDLNIKGKKVENTITDVEYAPDLDYHMISTDILDRKGCSITTRGGRLTVIDLEDDTIFMTETIQPKAEGNSYYLDLWHPPIRKVNAVAPTWEDWHGRLRHLNMQDVKKLASMGLISGRDGGPEGKCEACVMGKMHRKPNHQPVRANRRANRPGQRFHTDLAGGGKIVLTPKGKRYAIIFVDDFSDYTFLYLVRKKDEFQRILRDFIKMVLAKGLSIEAIRCDNAKENINKITTEMLRKQGIQ